MPWYSRLWSRATASTATVWAAIVGLATRTPPPRPGIASGRVVSQTRAEADLQTLALSPTVYAAITERAFSIASYPVSVSYGYAFGGNRPDLLDPERVPWVGSLLRLIQSPDPADTLTIFPRTPGEGLIAQIVADLLLTGNFWVAITQDKAGNIIGLERLHPRLVTLERSGAMDNPVEEWVYRPTVGLPRRYLRGQVAHGRLLSWQATGAAEIGTGAGSPLEPLVQAEYRALRQTASVIQQGGADVVITGEDAQTKAFLSNEKNRNEVRDRAIEALSGGPDGSRRVVVLPGSLKMDKSGLEPADLKAPELMDSARDSELRALGCTPVVVGSDSGTFATAAYQHRVQAQKDQQVANIIEGALLRPLARHFARMAGGRWAVRFDQVTAKIGRAHV